MAQTSPSRTTPRRRPQKANRPPDSEPSSQCTRGRNAQRKCSVFILFWPVLPRLPRVSSSRSTIPTRVFNILQTTVLLPNQRTRDTKGSIPLLHLETTTQILLCIRSQGKMMRLQTKTLYLPIKYRHTYIGDSGRDPSKENSLRVSITRAAELQNRAPTDTRGPYTLDLHRSQLYFCIWRHHSRPRSNQTFSRSFTRRRRTAVYGSSHVSTAWPRPSFRRKPFV